MCRYSLPGTSCLSPGLQIQAALRDWAGDSSHKTLLCPPPAGNNPWTPCRFWGGSGDHGLL